MFFCSTSSCQNWVVLQHRYELLLKKLKLITSKGRSYLYSKVRNVFIRLISLLGNPLIFVLVTVNKNQCKVITGIAFQTSLV